MAYMLRFCKNLRLLKNQRKISYLEVTEITEAETVLLLKSQELCKSDAKFEEVCHNLQVYQDVYGILKVKGRITEAKNQPELVLVFRNSHLATLIVRKAHKEVLHSGVSSTLAQVRSRFWIQRGRQFVKKSVK